MIQNKREYYLAMAELEAFIEKGVDNLSGTEIEAMDEISIDIERYEEILYPMPTKEDEDEERGRVIALHECAEKMYAELQEWLENYGDERLSEALQAYEKWREGDTVDTPEDVINRLIKYGNIDVSKIVLDGGR